MVDDHDVDLWDTQEIGYYLVHADHVGDLERTKCQTFDRKQSSTQEMLAKIKAEANAWMMAGAKPLAFLLARE